jgi:hypothetical protein
MIDISKLLSQTPDRVVAFKGFHFSRNKLAMTMVLTLTTFGTGLANAIVVPPPKAEVDELGEGSNDESVLTALAKKTPKGAKSAT